MQRKRLAPPPPTSSTPSNLHQPVGGLKDLNFKVPVDFHQEFKMCAVQDGLKMNELLRVMFDHYRRTYNNGSAA